MVATVAVALCLVLERLFGDTLNAFVSDVLRGLDALPQWLIDTIVIATRVLSVAVLLGGLAWTTMRRGLRMLGTLALAVGVALAAVVLLDGVPAATAGAASIALDVELGPLTDVSFPSVYGIAALAAALTAAAPWLARSWRRWGWVAVFGLVVTRFMTAPTSFGSGRAVLFGWFGGAAALVALGAPLRQASAPGLIGSLADVGLPLVSLEAAGVDARGSTPYFGTAVDGSRYFVKALGRDQRSADLLFRLYRMVQRRDLGDERPFSSLKQAVEHEALVALAAANVGSRTPRIRALARAEPNTIVLAYDAVAGRSLDRLAVDELDDGVLRAIWEAVAHLRAHRIAHRDLRLANLFLGDDGAVWMIDFGFSELAASDLVLATDVAELVASSSVVVGAARATSHAWATVDPGTLARACDRLRPWALSGATRSALKGQPGLLEDLRARLSGAEHGEHATQ